MDVVEWKKCRICNSADLMPLFSLGTQYVNDFVPVGQHLNGIQAPITLDLCNYCTLVQLRHTAPQEILYSRHYWYRSGVTDIMRAALRDITAKAEDLVNPEPYDIVLDIGSNDGTLLRTYTLPQLVTFGVEPATNLAEEGQKDIALFANDFWSKEVYWRMCHKKARIVTAIGMFYDLDDPNKFIADIADVLAPDGIFIAQLMCLRHMLEQGDVGNLAHEHLEFYSYKCLKYLYESNGLEIIDIECNDINGGSYRIYARLKGGKVQSFAHAAERLQAIEEAEQGYDHPATFDSFYDRLQKNKNETCIFIKQEIAKGKRVWVYGASTKGNVILQYYGLDSTIIEGAAERSPEKWGKVTIGTGIPIYSEEDARKAKPDYFLVLPYAFLKEFLVREVTWRLNGGKFIVPLPYFRVV